MTALIDAWNAASGAWVSVLVPACLAGTVALGGAWLLVRLFPRMRGETRCWLWRLAFAKLLLAMVWLRPLSLPVLPASPPLSSPRVAVSGEIRSGAHFHAGIPHSPGANSRVPSPPRRIAPVRVATASRLLAAWIVGVLFCAGRLVGAWRRTLRLRRACRRIQDPTIHVVLSELCARTGVPAPQLLEGPVHGPMLLGLFRPAILLPSDYLESFTPRDVRLALAHELSHFRRRDLLWSWLPVAGCVLFFFHPLAWFALGECRLAQEMACDEAVLALEGTPAADYGSMLLRLAASGGEASTRFSAVHALEPGIALERRLIMLRLRRSVSPGSSVGVSITLLAAAVLVLVPWRATAREAAAEPKAPAPSTSAVSGQPSNIPALPAMEVPDTAYLPQEAAAPPPALATTERVATGSLAAPASRMPEPGNTAGPRTEVEAPTPPVAETKPSADGTVDASHQPASARSNEATDALWEDSLLLSAGRFLRLSRRQWQEILPLARTADDRMAKLRSQQQSTLDALNRLARRRRDDLLAGRRPSPEGDAEAAALRRLLDGRRDEATREVVAAILERFTNLLTREQQARVYLLESGALNRQDVEEPALLDPAAGFVTGSRTGLPADPAVLARDPADILTHELNVADFRLKSEMGELQRMTAFSDPTQLNVNVDADGVSVVEVAHGKILEKYPANFSADEARRQAVMHVEKARQRAAANVQDLTRQVALLKGLKGEANLDPVLTREWLGRFTARLFTSSRFLGIAQEAGRSR